MKSWLTCCEFLLAGLMLGSGSGWATTTWTGAVGNDWFNDGNWSGGVPGADTVAVIDSGAILLTNQTAKLASLTMNGGTLTFSNWNTRLCASNVILNSGSSITLPPAFSSSQMSNNVYILCTNFFLDAGASVSADAKGWSGVIGAGNGPGIGSGGRTGAGYGGWGGKGMSGLWGPTYGSASAPLDPGSSGNTDEPGCTPGSGGGAVRIQASGNVVLNGTITANGAPGPDYCGGGSGGGIFITCRVFYATNGLISAIGGSAGRWGGGAGGGRIAVIYDAATQSNAPAAGIRFLTTGGSLGNQYSQPGDIGTLYFPDSQFLTETVSHSGQWMAPNFTNWAPDCLLVTNGWIRLFSPIHLAVTHDVMLTGPDAHLELGGNTETSDTRRTRFTPDAPGPALDIGGSLTITNGARLIVYSGPTNSFGANGARVAVAGDMSVAANSWIYPYSNPTNGGSAMFTARNIWVQPLGGIDADGKGYGGVPAMGVGPGAGDSRAGSGYGGRGGNGWWFFGVGGGTYGSETAPVDAGSSGSGSETTYIPGNGGGAIRVVASGTINLNGTLTANGYGGGSYSGGGAGGSVYLTCSGILGDGGLLSACGGDGGSYGGGGGGGRIAVWRRHHDLVTVSTNVLGGIGSTAGAGYPLASNGCPGTVHWDWLPIPGAIFTIR